MVDAVEHGRHEGSEMIAVMDVDAEEAERLLAAVRDATRRAKESRAKADEDSALRRVAVAKAMMAGVPRDAIAEAAEVHRNVLYQIVKKKNQSK
ncbi:hypothetical protein [Nocardia farcinica]|uniref:hypothetical protein n=1 Tax=Nocardia farcinica TaxID=37329 RepID=UPI001964ADA9|nr:hypothetical protein [Nocardia farcinica]